MKKRGILVVSYGSSYRDEREKGIGGIEKAIAANFPEYKLYRAFTSIPIIERIKKKEKIHIDTIREALGRAVQDGMNEIIIIQTHLVKGVRYEALIQAVEEFGDQFDCVKVAEPILSVDKNTEALVDMLEMLGRSYDDGRTAICYVGHGIEESSNEAYGRIQDMLWKKGFEDYYIGTLSVKPTLEEIVQCVKSKKNYERVALIPLMLVSGYHVRKDLIGERSDSWKNTFVREGYEVECVQDGLGEQPMMQKIFAEHLKSVML